MSTNSQNPATVAGNTCAASFWLKNEADANSFEFDGAGAAVMTLINGLDFAHPKHEFLLTATGRSTDWR